MSDLSNTVLFPSGGPDSVGGMEQDLQAVRNLVQELMALFPRFYEKFLEVEGASVRLLAHGAPEPFNAQFSKIMLLSSSKLDELYFWCSMLPACVENSFSPKPKREGEGHA